MGVEGHLAEGSEPLRPHDRMIVETEDLGEHQHARFLQFAGISLALITQRIVLRRDA